MNNTLFDTRHNANRSYSTNGDKPMPQNKVVRKPPKQTEVPQPTVIYELRGIKASITIDYRTSLLTGKPVPANLVLVIGSKKGASRYYTTDLTDFKRIIIKRLENPDQSLIDRTLATYPFNLFPLT
jgi:hypothetical protein